MMSATEHPTKTPDTANGATSPRPRAELLARLLDPEQVIMFDGAMGTMLYARGVFINQCYDELVLRSPDLVREIHAAYVKAGAEVIASNGKPFAEQSIGMTLAVRNLMTDLRSSGEVTGGPKSFAPRDRSASVLYMTEMCFCTADNSLPLLFIFPA